MYCEKYFCVFKGLQHSHVKRLSIEQLGFKFWHSHCCEYLDISSDLCGCSLCIEMGAIRVLNSWSMCDHLMKCR
jgi:hypothetical protein